QQSHIAERISPPRADVRERAVPELDPLTSLNENAVAISMQIGVTLRIVIAEDKPAVLGSPSAALSHFAGKRVVWVCASGCVASKAAEVAEIGIQEPENDSLARRPPNASPKSRIRAPSELRLEDQSVVRRGPAVWDDNPILDIVRVRRSNVPVSGKH